MILPGNAGRQRFRHGYDTNTGNDRIAQADDLMDFVTATKKSFARRFAFRHAQRNLSRSESLG